MIKDLTEAEAGHLAKIFDFSGGQIENVARKYAIARASSWRARRLPSQSVFTPPDTQIK